VNNGEILYSFNLMINDKREEKKGRKRKKKGRN
jgi:hypothetical protein